MTSAEFHSSSRQFANVQVNQLKRPVLRQQRRYSQQPQRRSHSFGSSDRRRLGEVPEVRRLKLRLNQQAMQGVFRRIDQVGPLGKDLFRKYKIRGTAAIPQLPPSVEGTPVQVNDSHGFVLQTPKVCPRLRTSASGTVQISNVFCGLVGLFRKCS